VTRFSENDAARDRVLGNPIYQHVSDALAGSAEYSAMEKVYELTESGVADLIVLDTPPSQHAIDFLEAPERLLAFLESPVVQLLFHPAFAAGRMGMRLFQRGTVAVLRTIERVAGIGFLEDISEFLLAFEGMAEGFRERARAVQALLVGPDAAFVLASGPDPQSVAQAGAFLDRLEVSKIRVAGLLLNRMHLFEAEPPPLGVLDEGSIGALTEALAADAEPGYPARKAAEAAISTLRSYAAMVDRDRRATEPLIARAARAGIFHRRIPEFDGDVHDLEGLLRIASYIFPAREDA
jgi:anion-transporting  ArsA/GET3 family ATPase